MKNSIIIKFITNAILFSIAILEPSKANFENLDSFVKLAGNAYEKVPVFSSNLEKEIYEKIDMKNEPFPNQKKGKIFIINPTLNPPIIDGIIDDIVWSEIIPITDFVQEEPSNMQLPTEKIEVFLTYDSKSLFIAAKLYDSNSNKITKQLAPRDDWYGAFDDVADWFSVDIDSRHDHQTGYSFAVNSSGVLSDEMVFHDSEYDNEWNAIWNAEVSIDDFGWYVEIEIPFSNLPFYKSEDMIWGINFTRFIERKYETVSWLAFPLDVEGIVSKYGHLIGLSGIYPPAKFEFKPYSMMGSTNYSDVRLTSYENPQSWLTNYNPIMTYNVGLDLQYRINNNSKFTFTINPDFGQVESDPADINLTAYETYFKEKRPFFIKDTDIFETPIEIFYSRRIGEKAWGEGIKIYKDTLRVNNKNKYTSDTLFYDVPVIIKGAAKIAGKLESGFSYGLLAATTTINDSSSWLNQMNKGKNRNYIVSRIKQDFFRGNSSIGFMSTSSIIDTMHILSIDGMSNLWDNILKIDFQVINDMKNNYGLYTSLNYYPSGIFSSWLEYYKYDNGIDLNNLGYLWRDDYKFLKSGIKFESLESWYIFRNSSFILQYEKENNSNNVDLGETIEINYDFQFDNFWNLGGGIYRIYSHVDDRKIILDYDKKIFGPSIKIPRVNGSYISIKSDKRRQFWAMLSLTRARNTRNDTEIGNLLELNYKPGTNMNFSVSYDSYRLKKKYHWLETLPEEDGNHHIFSDLNRNIDALNLKISGNYNKNISLTAFLELYTNHDKFIRSTYSEYIDEEDYFDMDSDYIRGEGDWVMPLTGEKMPVYTTDIAMLNLSYLDPNLYNGLYPKFSSLIFNSIVKWNYIKGSNIYFVYSANKSVNGRIFQGINGFVDFLSFNSKEDWVEILRDQTIMIKIDYWFER